MSDEIQVRPFQDTDAKAAAQIFYDAVHIGAAEFYNQEQRAAWAAEVPNSDVWCDRLNAQIAYVAVSDEQLVGYMTLADDGYIDLAFVRPDKIGTGVAKALYDAVEAKAIEFGASRLYSTASFLAKRFFERQGWSMLKQQTIERHGVELTNFAMEKRLS
ncbi:MAG: GNAT family N-acetyltransferase [Rhizobiales bacterium]|nr:GNAT family N-acetyltransferase [Hyphomicrobiales bacterium]NRB14638.1 GNAT family N-acetyltransferase [Hyphomicrobiales bacterium]